MQSRVVELRERLKYIIVNTDSYDVTAEQLRQCEAIVEKLKKITFLRNSAMNKLQLDFLEKYAESSVYAGYVNVAIKAEDLKELIAGYRASVELRADLNDARNTQPVAYKWGGVLIRAEESHPVHRKEGQPLYAAPVAEQSQEGGQ